jgi:hypothetical protein
MSDTKAKHNIPVLLMLFNRPESTRQVFEKVRESRPARLFVAGNGPRVDVPKDIELCRQVRAIFDNIDWECEVHLNFRDVNIGMHPQWHQTMDWFFSVVDHGIILEDDCVPHPSFFGFCVELLDKYKDDERIMHINGSNFQFGKKRGGASYYFSKYPHVWGWATWKRAWKKYDNDLKSFPEFQKNNIIDTAVANPEQKKYWLRFFEQLYTGIYSPCDAKWLYAIWANRGLCITPNVNMVTNIGYGLSAGHTIIKDKTLGQESFDIGAIIHPDAAAIGTDTTADNFTFEVIHRKNFFQKATYRIIVRISRLFQ